MVKAPQDAVAVAGRVNRRIRHGISLGGGAEAAGKAESGRNPGMQGRSEENGRSTGGQTARFRCARRRNPSRWRASAAGRCPTACRKSSACGGSIGTRTRRDSAGSASGGDRAGRPWPSASGWRRPGGSIRDLVRLSVPDNARVVRILRQAGMSAPSVGDDSGTRLPAFRKLHGPGQEDISLPAA